jgi:hypothetical protein
MTKAARPQGRRRWLVPSALAVSALVLATACDHATRPNPVPTPTPTPSETSERAHLVKVELRTNAGGIVPPDPGWGDNTTYSCPTLECSIWVYVTSPGVPSRVITVETPSMYLLPPHASLTREDQIQVGQAVKVHTATLDASKLQMASGVYPFGVSMSETSDAWGIHTETANVRIDFH